MSDITDKERVRRLYLIEKLLDEGKSDADIAKEIGMSLMAVKRGIIYLEDLRMSDLTPTLISKKRSELYLKLLDAEEEAKKLFNMYKTPFKCPNCEGTGRVDTKKTKKKVKDKENCKDEVVMTMCNNCKGLGYLQKTVDVERFHKLWTDAVMNQGKLYGFDNIKQEKITINQQFNQGSRVKENFSSKTLDTIKNAIIDGHESKVRDDYEKSQKD